MTAGLCECGCGQATPLATRTRHDIGHVRGEPIRRVNGHGRRGQHRDGGLAFDKQQRRWRILCRDGSQALYARAVMEAHLGRALGSDELVHHLNGDSTDDRIENLQLVTRAEHIAIHREDLRGSRRAARAA